MPRGKNTEKSKELYAFVMYRIRTKLRYAPLKSTHAAILRLSIKKGMMRKSKFSSRGHRLKRNS